MPATSTPVRRSLRSNSHLLPKVADGLGAVRSRDHRYFDEAIRSAFADSLDLDAALKAEHGQENRWDYLLGHARSGELVAVEPHKAEQGEIGTIVKKRATARDQLRGHLRHGAQVATWLWVASGTVHFADTEKVRRLLDQNGIRFVGPKVTSKHLP
jgi:hypothetical protein